MRRRAVRELTTIRSHRRQGGRTSRRCTWGIQLRASRFDQRRHCWDAARRGWIEPPGPVSFTHSAGAGHFRRRSFPGQAPGPFDDNRAVELDVDGIDSSVDAMSIPGLFPDQAECRLGQAFGGVADGRMIVAQRHLLADWPCVRSDDVVVKPRPPSSKESCSNRPRSTNAAAVKGLRVIHSTALAADHELRPSTACRK